VSKFVSERPSRTRIATQKTVVDAAFNFYDPETWLGAGFRPDEIGVLYNSDS